MSTNHIDVTQFENKHTAHPYLRNLLQRNYQGNNVDAFFDSLCECSQTIKFEFTHSDSQFILEHTYAYAILMAISKATTINPNIQLIFTEDLK